MGVFIDPKVDWAFKRIFGDKVLLIDFLNSLLEGERVITELDYLITERVGMYKEQRKSVYDLYCKTDTGEHIIVEMQNRWQEFFEDRALYYSACSIVEQGEQGKWNFELTPVYGIFFINFLINKEETEHFCKDVMLMDKHTGKVFSKKLRQIYIELPRFRKSETDCENFFEYWIYNLVNMKDMNEIAFKDQNAIFGHLEEIASQANLSKEDRQRYRESWKLYNDYFNTIESAEKKATEEGLAKGLKEGLAKGLEQGLEQGLARGLEQGLEQGRSSEKMEIAKKMKAKGQPTDFIADITGLSIEEIEKL